MYAYHTKVTHITDAYRNATCSAFSVSVNASANSVCMTPTGPMPPKQKVTKQTLANPGQATVSKGGSDKVPRPPNAFIIYRKDWHSTILAQNPGVHNNSICKFTVQTTCTSRISKLTVTYSCDHR